MAAHAFLMLYGLFPFFIFGFLNTTFPHWLDQEPLPRRRYMAPWLVMCTGMALFYLGLFTVRPAAALGAGLYVAGAAINVATLLIRLVRSHSPRRWQVLPALAGLMGGGAGMALFCAWLAGAPRMALQASINAGLWLFLVPLVVAVSYRLIPFFSSRALPDYTPVKPGWTLPVIGILLVSRFALLSAHATHWLLLCDLPLALIAVYHSLRWRLWRSLHVPLLGMLHLSFAWFAIGMALYGANDVLALLHAPGLGLAPLHALGIGLIGGMLVAMASRVSLGHSGRPLVAGSVTLWAFAAVQVAAVTRVLAALPGTEAWYTVLVLAAAGAWLAAVLPWCARFGTIYLRPRADGRPG